MKKVLAGGTFSHLHPGHEFFLNKAKSFGDYLVVVVASDRTVKEKKGYVLESAEKRKEKVESLKIADKVVIGDDRDFFKIVEKENPDVIVLGYDQDIDEGLKEKIAEKGTIELKRVDEKYGDYSTSKILGIKKKDNII